MVKSYIKPINMYEVLCRIHAEIDNHASQKQLWESIKQNWSFVNQKLLKSLLTTGHPKSSLQNKPIIARNCQSHAGRLFSY
jgi:hypothetical protein